MAKALTKKKVKEKHLDVQKELFFLKDLQTREYVYQYMSNASRPMRAVFHDVCSAKQVLLMLEENTGRQLQVVKIGGVG